MSTKQLCVGAPTGRGAASAPTAAAHRHARGAVARAMARARGAATTRAAAPRGAPRSAGTMRAARPTTPPRRRTHGGTLQNAIALRMTATIVQKRLRDVSRQHRVVQRTHRMRTRALSRRVALDMVGF